MKVRPTAGAVSAGSVSNTVTVSSPNDPSDSSATATTTVNNTAPVADSQSVETDENQPVTITLTGSDPDGNDLTFEVVAGSGPTHRSLGPIGAPTCMGTVPKNCSATVTYTPNANYDGPDSFRFRVNDGATDSAPATVNITVNPVSNLRIGKEAPSTVLQEAKFTYTVWLENDGPSDATGVVVTDKLPSGVSFVDAESDPRCNAVGQDVTCNIGNLAVSAPREEILIKVTANDVEPQENKATVDSNQSSPSTSNSVITTVEPAAGLSITKKDSPDPVNVGQNLTYTITVSNAGPSPASNAKITDALPANTAFVSATPSQGGSCTKLAAGAGGTVECTFASLARDAKATVKIVVKPTRQAAGKKLKNTTRVTSDTEEPNAAPDDSASATTRVRPEAKPKHKSKKGDDDKGGGGRARQNL